MRPKSENRWIFFLHVWEPENIEENWCKSFKTRIVWIQLLWSKETDWKDWGKFYRYNDKLKMNWLHIKNGRIFDKSILFCSYIYGPQDTTGYNFNSQKNHPLFTHTKSTTTRIIWLPAPFGVDGIKSKKDPKWITAISMCIVVVVETFPLLAIFIALTNSMPESRCGYLGNFYINISSLTCKL